MKKLLSIACLLFILASCGKDEEWELNLEATATGEVVIEETASWELDEANEEDSSENDEWESEDEEVVEDEDSVEEAVVEEEASEDESSGETTSTEDNEAESSTSAETNTSGEVEISWTDQDLVEEFDEELDELFELLKTDDQ